MKARVPSWAGLACPDVERLLCPQGADGCDQTGGPEQADPHQNGDRQGVAIGAPARCLLDRAVPARTGSSLPWGTSLVNVIASFALGVLAASPVSPELRTAAGVGFCGALSTYSTFRYETVRLAADRAWLLATLNVGASLAAGLAAAYCGMAIGAAL